MAPEQMGAQPCDGRADQYALAVTVYELLAGRGRSPISRSPNYLRGRRGTKCSRCPRRTRLFRRRSRRLSTRPCHPNRAVGSQRVSRLRRRCSPPVTTPPIRYRPRPVPPLVPPPGPVHLACPVCRHSIPLTPSLFGKRVTCYGWPSRPGACRRTGGASFRRFPHPCNPRRCRFRSPTPRTRRSRIPARAPSTSHSIRLPAGRGWPVLVACVLALLVTAVGLGVYKFWPRGEKPDPAPEPDTSGLVSRDDVVTGIVTIDFRTRQKDAPPDSVDTYTVDLNRTHRG